MDQKQKFALAGGGDAGRIAAHALHKHFPGQFAELIWDKDGGAEPDVPAHRIASPQDCNAGFLLCSGYGRIIPAAALAHFPAGAYNAHPSLLPKYRGRHAIQWAIDRGETVFGVTVHRMTAKVDEGDILLMRSCRFGEKQCYPEISSKLADLAAQLLVEMVREINSGRPHKPIIVDHSQGSLFPRRTRSDNEVSFSWDSARIINRVRASGPAYPAFSAKDGASVNFTGYRSSGAPGEVLVVTPEGCLIATSDGVVWLLPDRQLMVGDVLE